MLLYWSFNEKLFFLWCNYSIIVCRLLAFLQCQSAASEVSLRVQPVIHWPICRGNHLRLMNFPDDVRSKETCSSEEEECYGSSIWRNVGSVEQMRKDTCVISTLLIERMKIPGMVYVPWQLTADAATKGPRQTTKIPLAIRRWRCPLFYH